MATGFYSAAAHPLKPAKQNSSKGKTAYQAERSDNNSPAPRPDSKGTRRSVSIAPPTAGRGTECLRRGAHYDLREGSSPNGRDPASRLFRDLRVSVSAASRARPAKPDAPGESGRR